MNKINNPAIFLLLLIIQSCAMNNEQDIDTKQFEELDRHAGSENYEVVEIVPKANLAEYFLLDTIGNKLFIDSYYKSLNKEENTYDALKFDVLGNIETIYETEYVLNDGTMWNIKYYSNWIINGDTTKHKYIDPFTNNEIVDPYKHKWKEQDYDKWHSVFKQFYEKATYIYIDIGIWFYYFKIEDKWYLLDDNLKGSPINFTEQYPPKEEEAVRMVEPKNLAPIWYRKAAKEDTSPLIKMMGYESSYFEEVDKGAFSYGYSAGWWYLEIYMPLGDTLRIKRYSDY
uniref:hypothetical protein n=1 Tax=Pricia sp. TaxID=2268138 RepID=UPI003593A360